MRYQRYREVLGLDIGMHSVKAVHAVKRLGGIAFVKRERVRLPADPTDRQRMLDALVARNKWVGLPCAVAVRGQSVMLREVVLEQVDKRRVSELVDEEIKQVEELSDQGTISDYVRQGRTASGGQRLLLAICRADTVKKAVGSSAALGFRTVDAVPAAAAVFRSVVAQNRTRSVLVCVDIGHESTELVVGYRKGILFGRRFAHANSEAGTKKWLDSLKTCMRQYESQFGEDEHKPGLVVLCGGGALLSGLKSRISDSLDIKTTVIGEARRGGDEDAPYFATATGLCLQALRRSKRDVSLLPSPIAEANAIHAQRHHWVAAATFLCAAMLLMVFNSHSRLARTRNELERQRSAIRRLESLDKQMQECERQISDLELQMAPFTVGIRNSEIIYAVTKALGATKHKDDWIVDIADAGSYGKRAGSTGDESFEQVLVEGYTPVADLPSVRAMIDALKMQPGILDADLLGDDRMRKSSEMEEAWKFSEGTLFAIELTIPSP